MIVLSNMLSVLHAVRLNRVMLLAGPVGLWVCRARELQAPVARTLRAHTSSVVGGAYRNALPGDTFLAVSVHIAHAKGVVSGAQAS
jgi:hypothetical protein